MMTTVTVLVRMPIDLDRDHPQEHAARALRAIIEGGISVLRLYPDVPTGRVELDETTGTITLHR